MTKQELLEECISLAYKINEYGSFVFVHISPHTKQTDFYFHLEDWIKSDKIHFIVTIYSDRDYKDFYNDNEYLVYNSVGALHEYLTNMLEEKENENE